MYPTIRTASVISVVARDPEDSEQGQDEGECVGEGGSGEGSHWSACHVICHSWLLYVLMNWVS